MVNIVKQDLISGLMILTIIAYMGGTINFLWEIFLGDIIKFFYFEYSCAS